MTSAESSPSRRPRREHHAATARECSDVSGIPRFELDDERVDARVDLVERLVAHALERAPRHVDDRHHLLRERVELAVAHAAPEHVVHGAGERIRQLDEDVAQRRDVAVRRAHRVHPGGELVLAAVFVQRAGAAHEPVDDRRREERCVGPNEPAAQRRAELVAVRANRRRDRVAHAITAGSAASSFAIPCSSWRSRSSKAASSSSPVASPRPRRITTSTASESAASRGGSAKLERGVAAFAEQGARRAARR